jgi:ABC-type Zn uptake system ZnuABC Zn-binding protein ZnuA
MLTHSLMVAMTLLSGPVNPPVRSAPPLKIVTSLTTYGTIAREIAGDRGTVTSIAQGDEDPHFVQPKPSFVAVLRNADLFVTTGLDLELWVPALLDRAGNRKVSEGGPGYVTAYTGIQLLEVPASLSRSEGDIHVDGNPHIHTDPLNGIIIAAGISRERRLFRRTGAGFREAGAGGNHGCRGGRDPHPGDGFQPAEDRQAL